VSRGHIHLASHDDSVVLQLANGKRHLTAVLTVDEARALSAYLLEVAKLAAAAGPAVGHA
jgi:hypothetical protein